MKKLEQKDKEIIKKLSDLEFMILNRKVVKEIKETIDYFNTMINYKANIRYLNIKLNININS